MPYPRVIKTKVPATTANMGPGFDCIGMALKLYNHTNCIECDEFSIQTQNGYPDTADNLIYRTMCGFYDKIGKKIPSVRLEQCDYIPMTRGLGSSAACIVSGLLLANELSGEKLPRNELIKMAAEIEGHPDNSTPAFCGGITIGAMTGTKLEYIRFEPPRNLYFVVMIPEFKLSTEKARNVLPINYSRADAVFNISRAALMTAALIKGDFSKLATAMDDRIHQPYRMPLVPDMTGIIEKAGKLGAPAFLSGAGPAIIAVTKEKSFVSRMREFLEGLERKWSIKLMEPDLAGARVF